MKKNKVNIYSENRFIQNYSLFILISLIAVIELLVFYDFIFFHKLYLFKGMASDSVNDTYPNYILISDYLRTEGIPKWSFRQGMGQNIFPFSFPDPFVSILYLLGRTNLAYGIAYMELLKILLAGILFYYFLKKHALSPYVCIIGGLLYSFSSFMLIGSCWNIFSTEAVYLVLLLLAFEKMYQDNNWLLFPIAVALIGIHQPFDLWLFGVFLLSYLIVRHLEKNGASFRGFFNLMLRTGIMAFLGVAMSAFFFMSELRTMLISPRGTGAAGYYDLLSSHFALKFESAHHYITVIMRLFSSELLGPSNYFGGWHNFMEAPMFYCGLISLLLVPQIFQFLDERKKQLYAIWLAFMVIPVILPFLRYSFWLFTGDYYRIYAFFISFILMFFSIQALHFIFRYNRINRKLLVITFVVLLILLYYPYDFLEQTNVLDKKLRTIVTLFLSSFTLLLLFIHNTKKYFHLQMIILSLLFTELVIFSKINVNERKALTVEEYRQKTGYSDYTIDAVKFIYDIDKGFFRISKNYSSGPSPNPSLNDAKIQRFKGTGSYHSFNQPHYVRFLAGMNIITEKKEDQTRWLVGLKYTPILHSYASVKYFLCKDPKTEIHINYEPLKTIGDVKIYRNKYALPLGFTYSRYISKRDFNKLTSEQKPVSVYKAFVLNDTIYKEYSNILPTCNVSEIAKRYLLQDYLNDLNELKKDTLAITAFSNNHITGGISLDQRKMLFLSIPYSEGWSAFVDGRKQPTIRINIGFTGLLLEKGEHKIELYYNPPLFYAGAFVSSGAVLIYLLMLIFKLKNKNILSFLLPGLPFISSQLQITKNQN